MAIARVRTRHADLADSELVARASGGDGGAWEAIVFRYRRLVYAVPTRFGLEPEDADEVFQDTFARLLERFGTIRDPSQVRAWLVTTARRLSLDTIAKRRAVVDSARVIERQADPGALPGEELARLETEQVVRSAFERLSDRCRRLLDLLYYRAETPSYQEIGRRLGMPVGSIGPTRARCLEKLLLLYQEGEQGRKV